MNDRRKTIKICCTGTWLSSSNVGDNAIMYGIIQSFAKKGNIDLTVFTSNPERVGRVFNVKALAPKKHPFGMLISILKANSLIFTGGTPFYDDSLHMLYFLSLAMFAKACGTKIIVFAISLRNIRKPIPLLCMKLIVRLSNYIGARENQSYEKFKKHFPASTGKLWHLPDPAISITDKSETAFDGFLKSEGLDRNLPWIAVCPRDFSPKTSFQHHHYGTSYTKDECQKYVDSLKQLTEWLVMEQKVQVVFIPMHIHFPDDDRMVGQQVYDGIQDEKIKNSIYIVRRQYGPMAIRSILSKAKLVIGVRFHSLVLAFSTQTPIISIGYAKKNHAIMQLFGLDEYCLSIDSISFPCLKSSVEMVVQEEYSLKKRVADKHSEILVQYEKELAQVFKIINNH